MPLNKKRNLILTEKQRTKKMKYKELPFVSQYRKKNHRRSKAIRTNWTKRHPYQIISKGVAAVENGWGILIECAHMRTVRVMAILLFSSICHKLVLSLFRVLASDVITMNWNQVSKNQFFRTPFFFYAVARKEGWWLNELLLRFPID